jgi:RNA polymerase sigma factor (sigma-70 family)
LQAAITKSEGSLSHELQMNEHEWLAERFEKNRARLRSVAYRMLGSLTEAEDAVQETWLRLNRVDTRDEIQNLGGWLTTVVGRVCLDMLRSRNRRGEVALGVHVPEPIVSRDDRIDPEHAALLADSVGLALLTVLETLPPPERLAFVLHDMFGVPFDEIAPILGRSTLAARQLATRARRRVREVRTVPDSDLTKQREVVDAFLAAARRGDFDALVAILDPDVILRADRGAIPRASRVIQGALTVAQNAWMFSRVAGSARTVLVNGAAGIVGFDKRGQPIAVMGFIVTDGKIVEIDILADTARLRELDLFKT